MTINNIFRNIVSNILYLDSIYITIDFGILIIHNYNMKT